MKTKLILTTIIIISIIYLISWLYLGYSISKSDNHFYIQWKNEDFFRNEYKMVIWGKSRIPHSDNIQEYLEVDYLSERDNMRLDNLILKNIHTLKKGDTIIKPKNNYDLFLIKNNQKIKLDYSWSWE